MGRLYRRLGDPTEALIEATLLDAATTYLDGQTVSLDLTRGAAGDGSAGLSTNTATVTVGGEAPPPRHDDSLRVRLTDYGAALVADLAGNVTASQVQPRWFGRVGRQNVTDFGPARRETQIIAADWLTEVSRAAVAADTLDYPTVPVLVADALTRAQLPAGVPITLVLDPPGSLSDGLVWNAALTMPVAWSDLTQTFLTDVGHCLYVRRDGSPAMTSLARLAERAAAWSADTSEPLTRRQSMSPTQWEQPTANPAVVKWTTLEPRPGGVTEVPHEFRIGSGARPVQEDVIDLNAVEPFDYPSVTEAMHARGHRAGSWAYTVPTVSVDVLRLLSSAVPGDRRQAGQLLTLEPFDPIALSYDWPDPVIGLHHVTSISETITRDRWDITLGLAPTLHVTGEPSPAVPGRTWDTAYPRTTDWDTPPATTTWANAPEGA